MSKRVELNKLGSLVLYRDVMELIKIRQNSSRFFQEWCQSTKFENIPGGMGIEFLYLQLRMICESIAMACLIAHNDISETKNKKFFNNWRANEIIDQLERLHKDFYPHPVKQILDQGGNVIGVSAIEDNYLTKSRFLSLFVECNDHLHIGSLKKNLQPMKGGPLKVDPIIEWHNEINALLNIHWIPLADGKSQLWTIMQNKGNNNVRVDLFLNGPPAPFINQS
jgi:hypothetical protein